MLTSSFFPTDLRLGQKQRKEFGTKEMMLDPIARFLRAVGLYRPAVWTKEVLRKSVCRARSLTGFALRHPRAVVNDVVCRLARKLGSPVPGSWSYWLLDRFYYQTYWEHGRSTVAAGTRSYNRLTGNGHLAMGPHALLFLPKGPWYGHVLHQYLIGCALRELGYRVSFVVCRGGVERCGVTMVNHVSVVAPPFPCSACREITGSLAREGFGLINLNDYRTADEEDQVGALGKLSREKVLEYQVDGRRLGETLGPFLMRFYFGDYRRIEAGDREVLNHAKAGVRYLLRCKNLLAKVQPSLVGSLNGLLFPECCFFQAVKDTGTPALFFERGLKKNTLFLSLNVPACHYRSDRLWEHFKPQLTEAHAEIARAYVARRLARPEDPQGAARDILDTDERKYLTLAEKPYVVFFAPVTHDTASMAKAGPAGDLFETLGQLCRLARESGKRLVVRSHPDERMALMPSYYPMRQYLADQGLLNGERVICLDSDEKWNPYVLAQHADAVVVYNGTLGFELPCLGYEVFNIAGSHYANRGFTADVKSLDDLGSIFQRRKKEISAAEQELALKHLYYFVFVACLPADRLLDEHRPFSYELVSGANRQERLEQLDGLRQRLAFLLRPYQGQVPEPPVRAVWASVGA